MGQLADHELTPAAASIRKELESRFMTALELLDEEDRDILLMRHFEQLGNSEVAEALGLSTAAAGMRHLRALRKLRAILGERPLRNREVARNHETSRFMKLDRDKLLVSLLERVLESSRDGGTDALESIIREHPDLAIELRELWATMQIAEDFASISELFSHDVNR